MSAAQQQALFDNTARAIQGAARQVQDRHIAHRARADAAYGAGVEAAIQAIQAARSTEEPTT